MGLKIALFVADVCVLIWLYGLVCACWYQHVARVL